MSEGALDRLRGAKPVDVLVAFALALVLLVATLYPPMGVRAEPPAALLAAASALPLVVRRTWPIGALAGVLLLSLAYMVVSGPGGAYVLPLSVALYGVARAGERGSGSSSARPRSRRTWAGS